MSTHAPGDVERHNVPGPAYTAMLDEDRFAVPDILRERYPWPEDLSQIDGSNTSTERICSMSDNSVAVKVVQEFWETFGNKHDVEAAASFIDPDVLRRGPIPDPEEKDTCRGKDLYVTYLNHVMKVIPNYHVELFRIFGSDNGYVAMQGTERICLEPGSDQETINSVFGLFHVNDKGLIDLVDWYWKQPDPEILKWAAARNISAAGEAS